MVTSANPFSAQIEYPDSDGLPMAEGDIQRKYLTYCTEALELHFQARSDVYVAGNLFIYYEEGNPASVVAPDVFVIFGVSKQQRQSYKTWENSDEAPAFVMEITSNSTKTQDQGAKRGIYRFLGVQEYVQYDPTGDYLNPLLQGLSLQEENYFPIALTPLADGGLSLPSAVLGLELHLSPSGELRFYDPVRQQKLLSHAELDQARREAEARAEQEAAARQAMAARLAELEARLQERRED